MPLKPDESCRMAAHAAACIDAYAEGQLLTGQATSPSLEELTRRALAIHQQKKRLFVFFGTSECECHAVGPATRCFCSHSYSSHAWYETDTKRVGCRVDGCRCSCFSYVPGRGSTHIRCACKHSHAEHSSQGRPAGCRSCACDHFHSDWRCACGATYDEHGVSFMTAAERVAAGRPVEENLGGWGEEKPHLEAVCGGVTRMTSLLSGVERLGIAPLPHTDGAAANGPTSGPAASSTAAILCNYDQRADAHVARLRKLRDGQAARAGGKRLGSGPTPLALPAPTPHTPPRGGAARGGGVARGGGAARGRGGARGSGLVGAPPSARTQRELAAAAAEARVTAAVIQCAPCTAATVAATAVVASTAATAGRPAAPSHVSGGSSRPPAQKGPPTAGRPKRSSAGVAVAAARRERAANAAEQRTLAVVATS